MKHWKKYAVVIVAVFVVAAGAQYLANVRDVFATPWSTWSIVINAGIVAVVGWLVAYAGQVKADMRELQVEFEAFRQAFRRAMLRE